METADTIKYIAYHITDISALIDFCTLNGEIMSICSDRSFWQPIFEKYNLPLDKIYYTTAKQWIKLFIKTVKIMNKVNEIIDTVENSMKKFDLNIIKSDLLINLLINHNILTYIDLQEISEMTHIDPIIIKNLSIFKNDNKWYVRISIETFGKYKSFYNEYDMTKNQIINFLYDVLNENVI
jgi:hypothetical protein